MMTHTTENHGRHESGSSPGEVHCCLEHDERAQAGGRGGRGGRGESPQAGRGGRGPIPQCTGCGMFGHLLDVCRKRNTKCDVCGQKGHIEQDTKVCPGK